MNAAVDAITTESISAFPAIPMKFALSRASEAVWSPGPFAGLQCRDLLLGRASSGQMGGWQRRALVAGRADRWGATLPFRFVYVIAGTLSFYLGHAAIRLAAGDTALTDTLTLASRIAWSEDFDAVEITAPEPGPAVAPAPLLDMAAPTTPTIEAARAGITRDGADAYKPGDGPRRFLEYRDLGVIAATRRRIHIHQVRAIDTPEGGTGWHIHSMSQLFHVLRGWVDISIEGQGTMHMLAGDAMCIGANTRHDVSGFSSDYDLIEVCLPADYTTKATPAPGVP